MTKTEQILLELDKAGSQGLTSRNVRERVDIEAGSLRAMLYDLRKKEWIRKAGGTRGNFSYAITNKGRTELYARQPLAREKSPFPSDKKLTKAEEDYDNVLRLLDRTDEYTLLRKFVSYLIYESDLDLSGSEEITSEMLQVEVLRFMGIDPHEINATLSKLDEISTALRSTM